MFLCYNCFKDGSLDKLYVTHCDLFAPYTDAQMLFQYRSTLLTVLLYNLLEIQTTDRQHEREQHRLLYSSIVTHS